MTEQIEAAQRAEFKELEKRRNFWVRELEYGKCHDFYEGAPSDWAAERGATHTLFCGIGVGKGSRPARLLKTVAYVGVDETADGSIVWEKWKVKSIW